MTDKKRTSDQEARREGDVQGEGDYVAARRFDEAERSFVRKADIEAKAREAAAALEGHEADELEAARKSTAEGKTSPSEPGDASDPHEEHKLDRSLDQTFPASDPPPASRGAD
jgi:hypothetical protein